MPRERKFRWLASVRDWDVMKERERMRERKDEGTVVPLMNGCSGTPETADPSSGVEFLEVASSGYLVLPMWIFALGICASGCLFPYVSVWHTGFSAGSDMQGQRREESARVPSRNRGRDLF